MKKSHKNHMEIYKNHIEEGEIIMRKKTMKRIGSWALVLAMAAALMGCAASGPEATDPSGTTGPAVTVSATDPGKATQPGDITTPAQGGKGTEPASEGQPSSSGSQGGSSGNQGSTGNHEGSESGATQPKPTEPGLPSQGGNNTGSQGNSSQGGGSQPTTAPTQPNDGGQEQEETEVPFVCGVTRDHIWSFSEAVPNTCTTDGYDVYVCSWCGATETRPGLPASHNWQYDFTPEEGHYIRGVACACGTIFSNSDEWWSHATSYEGSAMLDHGGYGSYSEWIVDVPFSEWWYCTKCGVTSSTNPNP